jgi:hypothetical protein
MNSSSFLSVRPFLAGANDSSSFGGAVDVDWPKKVY